MKKLVCGLAVSALALGLASCGGGAAKEPEKGKTVENGTIGFILPGMTGDETKGYMEHWKALGEQYGVSIIEERFQGNDPAYYTTCADKLISAGADAIICSFEMDGKETVIEKCIDEEIYVGYSGSTVSADVFDEFKSNPYFIGQIAPTPATEEEEAYNMTKHMIEKYYGEGHEPLPEGTNGDFAIWPVDFHGLTLEHQMTYRWKGMKRALADYGVTILGDNNDDSAYWRAKYSADSILKDKVTILGNNLMDPKLTQQCTKILNQKPSVVVLSCQGDMLLNMFGGKYNPKKPEEALLAEPTVFATFDAVTCDYNKWYTPNPDTEIPCFKVAHEAYMITKFSAINEAIVAMTCRAFEGNPVRDNGNALNINQSYWIVDSLEDYTNARNISDNFSWKKEDFAKIATAADLQKLYNDATIENLAKLIK